ncbi:YwiC-like family protein [Xylanimonas ulmi]|uniref:YwiC-like protein n=1 Tax=Xylanimonas ulmi TaxID=228973 RepID=A0A4Q7M5Q9_9MICO|nr:YwiC-like protein [Xylanibacterium ulmi]
MRSGGWVPNQHGAWAMLALPFLVGVARGAADGALRPVLVPLLALWFVGYFAYFALGLWLKSRRRPRYLPAMWTYGGATAALGLTVLALDWRLIAWAPVFAPFLALGLWAAARRTERSVLAGGALVAAASIMTLVAYTAGRDGGPVWRALARADAPIGLLAALAFAYLFGTVLYVKSMIRERGVRAYALASIGYHAAVTVAAVPVALARDPAWWWAVAFLAAMTARAWALSTRRASAKALGLGEVAATVALGAIALALP